MVTSSATLLQELRQATKKPHQALDQHTLLIALLGKQPTLAGYGDALAALHGIFAPAEAWVLDFLQERPGLFDYPAYPRLPALDADLAALGRLPYPASVDFKPVRSMGALIGTLYPLEGSRLGGQVIARHLREHLGPGLPLGFFSGDDAQSRRRWEEFQRFAVAHCPAAEATIAIETAVSLFGAIKTHLDNICPYATRQAAV